MEIMKKIMEYVTNHYDQEEYNWYHNEYVTKYALKLGKLLNADLEILEVAARLHDIDFSRGGKFHTEDSANKAEELLRELGYPEYKIAKVKHSITCHTTTIVKNIENPSKEGKILHDADKMWTMTPKGFARTIAHRYKKNTSYEFIKSCLANQLKSYDNLFFEESKKIVKEEYEVSKKFLKAFASTVFEHYDANK